MVSFTKQVRPVTEPSSIRGLPNGDYPASSLVNIHRHPDGVAVGRLCLEAARCWEAMAAHAWRDNLVIEPTSPADSFRSLDRQRRLFADRYRRTDQGNGSRVCGGVRWFKRKGVATAACPGTSNHGKAIAVDIANCTGRRLAWLEQHAWTYGFAWELVPEEPWHIRYCTGDAIPAAVLKHENKQTQPPTSEEDDDMLKLCQTIDGTPAENAFIYFYGPGQFGHVLDVGHLETGTRMGLWDHTKVEKILKVERDRTATICLGGDPKKTDG